MFSDNVAQAIWKIFRPNVKHEIKVDTTATVKRIPAEVVGVDNSIRHADVMCLSDNTIMHLMNCSGKSLQVGDAVWVDYMYSLDNAYISIKNDGTPWGWWY